MKQQQASRRSFLQLMGCSLAGLAAGALTGPLRAADKQKPNVLFIPVDDLRTQLGCFGHPQMITPAIDRLAASGAIFTQAHCNIAVCGASRASLMTGMRPNWERFRGFDEYADKQVPGHLSLARHLKNNGYHTVSLGKVYHHADDDLGGWSEKPWRSNAGFLRGYIDEKTRGKVETKTDTDGTKVQCGPAWECADCADSDYNDGIITDRAIDYLKKFSRSGQPFFLATGLAKPHLPFCAPKKYWDLYDHDKIDLAKNPFKPKNAPANALHNSPELRNGYSGVPADNPLPDDYARWLVHGYYACVSYIDAQIGRLMQALDDLKLAENTIVIIWGDHGWNLGEHTMWCKHSIFETSLHAPIIIRAPGGKSAVRCEALVEYVDIYPTLAELCGVEVPAHCQGRSFVPLLRDPDQKWKEATFSRWQNGFTITTERYQFTQWRQSKNGPVTAQMLYDHQSDPDENVNVAGLPENAALVAELAARLDAHLISYP